MYLVELLKCKHRSILPRLGGWKLQVELLLFLAFLCKMRYRWRTSYSVGAGVAGERSGDACVAPSPTSPAVSSENPSSCAVVRLLRMTFQIQDDSCLHTMPIYNVSMKEVRWRPVSSDRGSAAERVASRKVTDEFILSVFALQSGCSLEYLLPFRLLRRKQGPESLGSRISEPFVVC